jgi:N-formylmaleamate deformylase
MLSNWTQHDVIVNGVQLHYTRTGHGEKRPLVLVHGFSDNGLCWSSTARDLEADYDVILPDMRGHGRSARVQPDEVVDMPADLAELICTLGLNRPIVAGHSMGAMVTFQIGVRFPELASALILEDPPWRLSWPEETDQPEENPISQWAKTLPKKTMDELLVEYRKDHPNWSEDFVRIMCESKKQLDPTIADIMVKRRHISGSDWLTTLPSLTHPVLLFAANPELGGIVTPEVVAKVRELNPGVTIVNIPDVGHLIRFDKYTVFMEAVRAFLRELPS